MAQLKTLKSYMSRELISLYHMTIRKLVTSQLAFNLAPTFGASFLGVVILGVVILGVVILGVIVLEVIVFGASFLELELNGCQPLCSSVLLFQIIFWHLRFISIENSRVRKLLTVKKPFGNFAMGSVMGLSSFCLRGKQSS
ncbi:hypothetical protein C2G38_2213452 [Gigaspora rosea]|uniref:Uncharacterized protein n=1 Tax=Gigaspora rosea TaxID=44941 RepID=A0A397UG46_9GLOM|nr:hypothetical protein C2G38_2213452 [Gigaspora rosea]